MKLTLANGTPEMCKGAMTRRSMRPMVVDSPVRTTNASVSPLGSCSFHTCVACQMCRSFLLFSFSCAISTSYLFLLFICPVLIASMCVPCIASWHTQTAQQYHTQKGVSLPVQDASSNQHGMLELYQATVSTELLCKLCMHLP